MLTKLSLLLTMAVSLSPNMKQLDLEERQKKITVIGRAISSKTYAAVKTDDSLVYYLDGISYWESELVGKRVKVTGKFFLKEFNDKTKSDNPLITAIPQQRFGTWRMLKKPKWTLVE
jgi:hypothetical protein